MAYSAKTNWKNNDIVTPDDLNRIEKGISDSAQKDLGNVTDAVFTAKAKKNNVAIYSTSLITLTVSPSGNDDTGTGTSSAPFRTIQKAIDALPDCNNLGVRYTINVAEGSYPGFTLGAFKNITMRMAGATIVEGDITVNAGNLTISTVQSGTTLTLSSGVIKVSGGSLDINFAVTMTRATPGTGTAVTCDNGCHFGVKADFSIVNYNIGINCSHSYISIRKLKIEAAVSGIICESGIAQMGAGEVQADTKFVIQHGGRIYVGAQTSLPNY